MSLTQCAICYAVQQPAEMVHLTCSCEFCRNCLADWVLAQLSSSALSPTGLTCPSAFRRHILQQSDVTAAFASAHSQQDRDLQLTRKLLAREPDVRCCPIQECGYLGWLDPQTRCYSRLECAACGALWSDPGLEPRPLRLYRALRSEDSLWTLIWLEVWTEKCPRCQAPIEKTGGCYHMTCRHCSHEFCWHCLHDFHGHSEFVCVLKLIYRYFLMMMLPIAAILKTGNCITQLYDVLRLMLYYSCVLFALAVEVRAHYMLAKGFWAILFGKGAVTNRSVQLCGFLTMLSLLELMNLTLFLIAGVPWHWVEVSVVALVQCVWAAPLAVVVYAVRLR